MCKRKCAELLEAFAVHIGFERSFQEGSENETVHLIEDDFFILENRCPAETLRVKTT